MTELADLVAAVDRDRLMAHMEEFARHTKVAGTPEELESLRYCAERMSEYGFNVEIIQHDAYISLPQPGASATLGEVTADAITHSFSRSAPAVGLTARVVDVGRGGTEDYVGRDVSGCIVLMDGIANPVVTQRASNAGAVGQIHVSPSENRHEMCISPVWGSPDDRKVGNLPTTVVCTVADADGARLREALAQDPQAEATLVASVDTGWRPTPILIADLASSHGDNAEPFVFYTGHHDTWYYGVMDNGGANATMLEVSRLAAQHRDKWRRGLRVAFWSGHSQGRYSSSSWYADHNWEELRARALVHVNVDSTGGRGNTDVDRTNAAAELRRLAAEAIHEQADQDFGNRRMGRAGDQSFWGIGVPAIFANMSTQPAEPDKPVAGPPSMFRSGKQGGFGTGWWWHTPDDLLDKIDADILVRDTRIYMHAIWRLLADPVLPFDWGEHGRYLLAELDELEEACPRFDLSVLRRRAQRFLALAEAVPSSGDADRLNAAHQKVAHALVPVDYTECDPFDHDPALPMAAYPSLQPLRELGALEEGSDAARFLETRLVRARTRVAVALSAACDALEEAGASAARSAAE